MFHGSSRRVWHVASHAGCVAAIVALLSGAATSQDIQYVIQVSVDGLHSGQLQSLMQSQPDKFTNFQRFVNEGATTFNARSDAANSFTLPNHASMMTGRPVNQPADDPTVHHGYLNNSTPKPTDTLHNAGNPELSYVASTFDQAHDRGLSTALYTSKEKFGVFNQSYNATDMTSGGRPDAFLDDGDQGINKIDKYEFEVVKGTSTGIMDTLVQDYQTEPFNYAMVHFIEPDAAGHAFGWRSQQWDEILEFVDQHLGRLFDLVETQPELVGRSAIVLTADHGGALLSHNVVTDPNVFRIPFFVWAPGVSSGADLYDLNSLTRRDPGPDHPSYTADPQPIRNADSANLAMAMLGLPPVEGSTINVRQDLRFEPPRPATWRGADDQQGLPGDGQSWADVRNWTRAASNDIGPVAGDLVSLPATDGEASINLGGLQQVHTLDVTGQYQLAGGELQLVTGELTVAENQRLTVRGSISSPRGVIKQGAGVLTVDSIVESDLLISAGIVVGPIEVDGDVANLGEMRPAGNESVQHVLGNYIQGRSGTLRFSLQPDGSNGQLVVDGKTIYRGFLALDTNGADVDPTGPGEFTRWELVSSSRRIGSFYWVDYDGQRLTFDQLSSDFGSVHVGDGLFRRLEYDGTSVNWVNYQAIPGDIDGDGAFNTNDLVGLFSEGSYENGTPDDADWTTGDWNGDRDFTSSDLVSAFVTGRFEEPSILEPPVGVPVPEPNATLLLFSACLLLVPVIAKRRTLFQAPSATDVSCPLSPGSFAQRTIDYRIALPRTIWG